jgi:hypothetical protein
MKPEKQMQMNRRDFLKSLSAITSVAALKAGADTDASRPPIPLQPFTVELLDLNRGSWRFLDWDGQHLNLPGPVVAYAYPPRNASAIRICTLCCDPEFPRDPAHGEIRTSVLLKSGGAARKFQISEPFFACGISVSRIGDGTLECRLEDITLGPAVSGDRYVEAIYIIANGKYYPLWLAPTGDKSDPPLRILTDRVGNIFTGDEAARITLVGLGLESRRELNLALQLTDYSAGKPIWSGSLKFTMAAGRLSLHEILIPHKRFGVFVLTATHRDQTVATLRICRIPKPRKLNPDSSAIGINIFQQQIWWYAFQVPMMAAAGVHWIRPWLAWENTWNSQQPQPDKWDTRPLDAALRRMDRYGMRYQDILFQAPKWIAGDAWPGVPPMTRMKEWGEYVQRLATQYKGRIPCYEVWNEPDGMWTSEDNAPEHYIALLKTAWNSAKKADPQCKILGLSLAGNMDWLKKVCDDGAVKYMDIATFHNYASPIDFLVESRKRIRILEKNDIHRYWINELGVTAYDFNTDYSQKYDCSERKQAITLVENYAQAMTLNPNMKAFWFCTYDPRDAAHESGWTIDAGIGLIYLGFLPKLAYAALAGYSWMTDGRRCLGRMRSIETGLQQVSFEGPVTIAWREGQRQFSPLSATQAGCLPDERIVVRDINTNILAAGKAGEVKLDFSQGPVYIEGSRQMAGMAAAEADFHILPEELNIGAAHSADLTVSVPRAEKIDVTPHPSSEIILRIISKSSGTRKITVTAKDLSQRVFGVLEVSTRFVPLVYGLRREVDLTRKIEVTANGGPDLIVDGAFCRGDLLAWTVQGKSAFAYDRKIGHLVPGSLRLTAPFSQRLVQWNIKPERDAPLHFKCRIRTDHLSGCRITLNLAWFGPKDWVSTSCLATTGEEGQIENGWQTVKDFAHIPTNTKNWEPIEDSLAPPYIPDGADHAAFFIDATGGGSGEIWLDDLDLWQPR